MRVWRAGTAVAYVRADVDRKCDFFVVRAILTDGAERAGTSPSGESDAKACPLVSSSRGSSAAAALRAVVRRRRSAVPPRYEMS